MPVTVPPEDEWVHCPDAAAWRAWLEANGAERPEVWLVSFKKHTGRPSVAWADAVPEALRHGWIDGMVKRIDEDRFVQRWTPRRPRSRWSKVNVALVERLIAEGRMTPAGMETVRIAKETGAWDAAYTATPALRRPPALREALRADPEAKRRWERMSTTWHNRAVEWILAAGDDAEELTRRAAHAVAGVRRDGRPTLPGAGGAAGG